MTRGVAHSPELRAQVIQAVASGMLIREAAREFDLDPTLVSRWVSAGVAGIATRTKESDAELIMGYFRAGFRAMIVQAEVLGDRNYCLAQDADKLAIAHGVLGDKLAGVAATAAALGFIAAPLPAGTLDETLELAGVDAARAPETANG
jgi:hypothetical protein